MPNSSEQLSVEPRDKSIGEIISTAYNLTDVQLDQVLTYQRQHKVKFGEAAVALGLIRREDVLWALSQQFHYPYSGQGEIEIRPELVAATQPFSEHAEIFRDVRSQLMLETPLGVKRALAVLSPDVGDGKSFFAANLAIAFSQLGGRVLLIDADMRSPTQHDLFKITETGSGLSGALSGRSGVNVIKPLDAIPSLFVLPVGVVPPNPLELLQRPAFGLLIHDVLGRFDHVIVDTPAASHGYDAKVIAAGCGAALLVGRKNVSKMESLNALYKATVKNAQIAGVVVNDY